MTVLFYRFMHPIFNLSVFFLFRFANSLPINDPLQTVYQLMSGRMPASATVNIASAFSLYNLVLFFHNYSEEFAGAVFSSKAD